MQTNKNPFRNASLPQNNLTDTRSYVEKRGESTRGRRGSFHSGDRGSFSGGLQFRGGRGRGGSSLGHGRGFKRGGMSRGRGVSFGTDHLTKKEEDWGKVKFNPVAATAKEEYATPWHKFKYDMVKNKDVNTADSEEGQDAKDFKEKRAQNNRKAQILLNQQQPTEWDDFGAADLKPEKKNRKKESKKQTQHNAQSLETCGRESSRANELLKNFESNNLSTAQKHHLRRVITKTTILAKGDTLYRAVEDLKRQEKLKVKRRKLKSELKSEAK